MVTFDNLLESALEVEYPNPEVLDEGVMTIKYRIDKIIKEILSSYSDNGVSTFKNGKIKLSLLKPKLERNIYSCFVKWSNGLDGGEYFKSIAGKIKRDIKTEGFTNVNVDDKGEIKIELTRADNNRINSTNKKDVEGVVAAGVGTAVKVTTGI